MAQKSLATEYAQTRRCLQDLDRSIRLSRKTIAGGNGDAPVFGCLTERKMLALKEWLYAEETRRADYLVERLNTLGPRN